MIEKERKSSFIKLISFILIAIGCTLVVYKMTEPVVKEKKENKLLEEFYKNEVILEQNQGKEEEQSLINEESKEDKPRFIAVLKIPKIKLEKGLYERNSKYNNIEYGIEILESSDSPEKESGNVILAAHAGDSVVSYFKNLKILGVGDYATIIYNGKTYNYEITKIYEVDKTGTIPIKRDNNISTLTLITCKHKTNKQIVLIAYLQNSI